MDLIIGLSVFAVLLLIDTALGTFKKPHALSMNEAGVNVLSLLLTYAAHLIPLVLVVALLNRCVPEAKDILHGMPLYIALPLFLLIEDAGVYLQHRLSHEIPVLWRMHKPHHIPTVLNPLMASRQSLIYYLLMPVNYVTPLFIYLGLYEAVTIEIVIKLTLVYLMHMGYRWDLWMRRFALGRVVLDLAESLFVLQDFHHAHHGIGRYGNPSTNYGNILNIWDRMFGTVLKTPGRWQLGTPHHTQDAFGVPTGVKVEGWASQLFWPLVREAKPAPATSPPLQQSPAAELARAAAVIYTANGLAVAVRRP